MAALQGAHQRDDRDQERQVGAPELGVRQAFRRPGGHLPAVRGFLPVGVFLLLSARLGNRALCPLIVTLWGFLRGSLGEVSQTRVLPARGNPRPGPRGPCLRGRWDSVEDAGDLWGALGRLLFAPQ